MRRRSFLRSKPTCRSSSTDLVCHPRILDAVEDVIGPNILCWGSSFFQKTHTIRDMSPGTKTAIITGWNLPILTALDCYFDEQYRIGLCEGHSGFAPCSVGVRHQTGSEQLASRGQTTANVDASKAVNMELRPGEFSLHHEAIVHNSEPNNSDDRRIGLSVHYIPTSTKQVRFVPEGKKPAAIRCAALMPTTTGTRRRRQSFSLTQRCSNTLNA